MQRSPKIISGVVALVLLAAACGSDATVSTSATTVAPTTAPSTPTTTTPDAPSTTGPPSTETPAPPTTTPTAPDGPAELQDARDRWDAGGLDDYVLRQDVLCFCPVEYTGPFRVDVVGGEIVSVEHTGLDESASPEAAYRSVDELFAAIEGAYADGAARVEVIYDDSNGLPTYVFIDDDEQVADEEIGWTTELLADQTPGGDGGSGDELAGEPFTGPKADRGANLIVVGVTPDDVLNVRATPGTAGEIVATIAGTGRATATGEARLLPRSLWFEVDTVDGTRGWVNAYFVAEPGIVLDVTSDVVAALGRIPSAATLVELADIVAATRASEDPPSTITVGEPSIGDVGEVTVDVIGLGDDAVLGERLVLFASPLESGDGWSLGTVEATVLCGRGVTDDGLCI